MAACMSVGSLPLALSTYTTTRSSLRPLQSLQVSFQGRQVLCDVHRFWMMPRFNQRNRGNPICAESSNAEKAFQTTVELDKFIDELRRANQQELPLLVAKNVLSFDTPFWMRLAARADICGSIDDKKDYEGLAASIMVIVERVIRKAQEKIEYSTDVLKSILKPITQSDEEIVWPPRDPTGIAEMKQVLERKEQQGFLDESFLSEVSAQIRQAREDGDKPGLVAILQKVLQLYAAQILSKRSYAVKDGQVDKAEEFLETIISADEEKWGDLLRTGIVFGGGQVEIEELYKVVNKRVERVTMRTESGSYQQRIVLEYLKEIEERAQATVQAFQASTT